MPPLRTDARGLYGTYGDEIEISLVDVDSDTGLKTRYGTRIPVLAAGQRVVCEARLDEAAVDAYFQRWLKQRWGLT